MYYVAVERWSRGSSPVHRRDPRSKIAVLLVFLIVLATTHRALLPMAAGALLLLAGVLIWARVPLAAALARAALVLPFTAVFALISWFAGEPGRAFELVAKSYLSALAVLAVVSTTPLPSLLRGLELIGAPRFVLLVGQFLYRYLFVIADEAQQMTQAAAARGASARQWAAGSPHFRAAAGALAVLFAKSYSRAEHIHWAMLARGFQGHFQIVEAPRFGFADALFAFAGSLASLLVRLAAERAIP